MPRKCSVIGCRGNYEARKGEQADVNKVTVFRFPKDECKKEQWLRRIPQELCSGDDGRGPGRVEPRPLSASRSTAHGGRVR